MVAILDFLENSKIAQNQQEIDQITKSIENISNLLKLSIWIENLEIKMYFKQFYVKIVKKAFKKVVAMATVKIGTDLINTPLSYLVNFMKSHQILLQ